MKDRRQLNTKYKAYVIGSSYNRQKNKQGGDRGNQYTKLSEHLAKGETCTLAKDNPESGLETRQNPKNSPTLTKEKEAKGETCTLIEEKSTAEIVAVKFGVGERTVKDYHRSFRIS